MRTAVPVGIDILRPPRSGYVGHYLGVFLSSPGVFLRTAVGSRYFDAAALILLIGYLLLGAATVSDGHRWGDDWAQYVMHSINMVEGRPYSPTGYIFNPDAPVVGPPSYPPGLPLILSPIFAITGLNLFALKIVCFTCLVGGIFFAFKLLRESLGIGIASATLVLFIFHDQIWTSRDSIQSDSPYLLVSMFALWLAARRDDLFSDMNAVFRGALLGLLCYAAVACRYIGTTLFAAILVYGLAQRKPVSWMVGFIASFCLALWVQSMAIVMPATYENELVVPTFELVRDNTVGYIQALGHLFRLPLGVSVFGAMAVILLVFLGVWQASGGRSSAKSNIISVLPDVPAYVWYLAAYMCALLLVAIPPDSRYYLPVLPLIFGLALLGIRRLVPNFSGHWLWPAVVLAAVPYYAALHLTIPSAAPGEDATCGACQELYAFVRTQTPPDAVIAFAKPRAMALFTGRPSWRWSLDYAQGELGKKIEQLGVDLLVIADPRSPLAYLNPGSWPGLHDLGSEVFRNEMFIALRPRGKQNALP